MIRSGLTELFTEGSNEGKATENNSIATVFTALLFRLNSNLTLILVVVTWNTSYLTYGCSTFVDINNLVVCVLTQLHDHFSEYRDCNILKCVSNLQSNPQLHKLQSHSRI